MLTVHYLEVSAEAITPLVLDAYCGSALRGAFFRAIWGRFCTNRESPTCDVCPLVAACPVASLVAPLRDEAPRGRDVPRPYILTSLIKSRIAMRKERSLLSVLHSLETLQSSTLMLSDLFKKWSAILSVILYLSYKGKEAAFLFVR